MSYNSHLIRKKIQSMRKASSIVSEATLVSPYKTMLKLESEFWNKNSN